MLRSISLAATVLAAVSMSACSDSASGPSGGGQVNFNTATRPSTTGGATALATVGSPETFSDGTNTLVIDQVQLVLREIEIKSVESTTACGESSNDA